MNLGYRAIQQVYNRTLRPLLPKKYTSRRGVAIPEARLFDMTDCNPQTEAPLIDGLETVLRRGDHVVCIAGGRGISMVWASVAVGPAGTVTVYEASRQRVADLRRVAREARINRRVDIRHGVVGPIYDVDGQLGAVDRVAVADLPDCDVLELDCEGSESFILDRLAIEPRAIVVEYHECFGTDRGWADATLTGGGYETQFVGIENETSGAGVVLGQRPIASGVSPRQPRGPTAGNRVAEPETR